METVVTIPVQPPFSTPTTTPNSLLWTIPIAIDPLLKTISVGTLPPVKPGDYIKWTTPCNQDPFAVVFGNPVSPAAAILPGASPDGGQSDSETQACFIAAPLLVQPGNTISYSYRIMYIDVNTSTSYKYFGDRDPVVIVDPSGG